MPFALLNHMCDKEVNPWVHHATILIALVYTCLYLELVGGILSLFGLFLNQGGIPFLFAIIFTVFVTMYPFFMGALWMGNLIELIKNARS